MDKIKQDTYNIRQILYMRGGNPVSLENGILGYLSVKPLSGYDIKKLFTMSAAYFWPADQAQIYRSLKKLVEGGEVELTEYSHGETVNKKVYAITDKGRSVLQNWMTHPNEADFISRLPFLMQIFFSGMLSCEEQLALLDTQHKANDGLLQKLKENYQKNGEVFADTMGFSAEDRRLKAAVYAQRWGIIRGEAYAAFLEEIKEEILSE